MTLTITSCERKPNSGPKSDRMSASAFNARLPGVQYPYHWFADYSGANIRTVQRWASGEQDIPHWVGRLLDLHARLGEAVAWSEQHEGQSVQERAWREAATLSLWPPRMSGPTPGITDQ